jgi:hypothetical protein
LAEHVLSASPKGALAMVESQVREFVAARAVRNLSAAADATKEALMDIYYEIEHTSLPHLFEDHKASVASLNRHRQNLADCQKHLSTAELDQLLLDHPLLKQESAECQPRVVALEAAMSSANAGAQKFVDELNTCHEWKGLGSEGALQSLKTLAARILDQSVPQLQDLKRAADNATDAYTSAKASCDNTTGLYMTTSCTLRTVVDVVIREYTLCRETEGPLLEQEKVDQSMRADRRKVDHVAYKKIQCFIGVLNATTNADAQSQLDICTSTNFTTDGLTLDEIDAVPESDTSRLLDARQAAALICPAPSTTTATTTSTGQAVTLHHCSFSGTPSGDKEVREHVFTEMDCGGSLPTGTCMGMLRRTVQGGRGGDWQADAPGTHGNLQPKIKWQCDDETACAANPNITVDYVCGLSPSLHSFTSCEGQTGSGSLTFTSDMCTNGLPTDFGATDCMAVMKRQWQSTDARGSEDFQLTWNPAKMTWWRDGSSGPSASRSLLGADFMCGVPSGFVLTHCEATATLPANGMNTITFTKDQCGGAYPAGECVAGLRKATQSGEDEDWQVFLPQENGGVPKVMWYMRHKGSERATAAADFLCRL